MPTESYKLHSCNVKRYSLMKNIFADGITKFLKSTVQLDVNTRVKPWDKEWQYSPIFLLILSFRRRGFKFLMKSFWFWVFYFSSFLTRSMDARCNLSLDQGSPTCHCKDMFPHGDRPDDDETIPLWFCRFVDKQTASLIGCCYQFSLLV